MAVSKITLPVNTLHELLKAGDYEAGMLGGVALEGLFRVSTNPSLPPYQPHTLPLTWRQYTLKTGIPV